MRLGSAKVAQFKASLQICIEVRSDVEQSTDTTKQTQRKGILSPAKVHAAGLAHQFLLFTQLAFTPKGIEIHNINRESTLLQILLQRTTHLAPCNHFCHHHDTYNSAKESMQDVSPLVLVVGFDRFPQRHCSIWAPFFRKSLRIFIWFG